MSQFSFRLILPRFCAGNGAPWQLATSVTGDGTIWPSKTTLEAKQGDCQQLDLESHNTASWQKIAKPHVSNKLGDEMLWIPILQDGFHEKNVSSMAHWYDICAMELYGFVPHSARQLGGTSAGRQCPNFCSTCSTINCPAHSTALSSSSYIILPHLTPTWPELSGKTWENKKNGKRSPVIKHLLFHIVSPCFTLFGQVAGQAEVVQGSHPKWTTCHGGMPLIGVWYDVHDVQYVDLKTWLEKMCSSSNSLDLRLCEGRGNSM